MRCNSDGKGLCGTCRAFCAIPPARVLGWPKNIGHATSPHQAMLARFAQRAAQVIAVSGTGEELTADLTVNEGHKHNTEDTLVEWRQLAAWPVIGRTLAAVVTSGQVISGTSEEDLGMYLFRMPLTAAGARVRNVFYPRVRATVPAPGGPATSTLIVTGDVIRIGAFGIVVVVATLPPLNIVAQAGPPVVGYSNQWFSFGAVEILTTTTVAQLGLRLRARVANGGEEGTAFEVAVGLRGGL